MHHIQKIAVGAAGFGMAAMLFAAPAFAADQDGVVTGYETGYTYHQGLATGAGGNLMAAQSGSQAAPATYYQPAHAATPAAPDTGSISSAPSSGALTADASGATYDATPAAPDTGVSNAPSYLSSISASTWIAIALLVIAFIVLVAMLAGGTETTVRRTYQRY